MELNIYLKEFLVICTSCTFYSVGCVNDETDLNYGMTVNVGTMAKDRQLFYVAKSDFYFCLNAYWYGTISMPKSKERGKERYKNVEFFVHSDT